MLALISRPMGYFFRTEPAPFTVPLAPDTVVDPTVLTPLAVALAPVLTGDLHPEKARMMVVIRMDDNCLLICMGYSCRARSN